ncbi:transglycosylase SLT domain-containing protein [Streptomyces sp. PT12]|uniref:transglycosylase SLT domain-containing protein n=1 Tax=Streptomyces sp. PT12 TaxID=1510197 RepID=UPI000DE267E8|nr:transglycosylase SLT domain-containing protein [Streptomyces sp. PT12]RBM19797.1 lytic transglycosylase [Streptomyces sp. PT12]
MPAHRRTSTLRKTRLRRTTTATLAAAGVCALALSATPAAADTKTAVQVANSRAVAWDVKAADLPGHRQPGALAPEVAEFAELAPGTKSALATAVAGQRAFAAESAKQAECEEREEREAAAEAERQAEEERQAEAERQAQEEAQAAEEEPTAQAAAEPEAAPAAPPAAEAEPEPAAEPAAPTYPDNLDGWIREALDVMAANGIPGTYDGLHRNIIRESSGDPNAINLWDINAINGTPSIGLLQVIQPTFDAYHVEGTPYDIYDPVANLVAAANYAWDRYGSIDNVNGPY